MSEQTRKSPQSRQMYCPACEKVVERDEVVKGYEFAKDQYVRVTDGELETLAPGSKAGSWIRVRPRQ